MDGVLEGAVVLCGCKLVGSLLFLPSLAESYSPVSFCCCCLLIFTDFLVTVFLSFLYVFESWVTKVAPPGNVIAFRFLVFLSHTYGAVLLLTTPLIAVETLSRLRRPDSAIVHRAVGQTTGSDGCYNREVAVTEEKEEEEEKEDDSNSHAVGYLCCLTVWAVVAVDVKWQWRLEEVRAAACLHTTNSLIRCLPNLLSPMPSAMNPCWGMAFLPLLLLLLTSGTGLHWWRRVPAHMQGRRREKHGVNENAANCWQGLVPVLPSKPVKPPTSEQAPPADPEKAACSCGVHRACSRDSMQTSACHHGDSVLLSAECLSDGKGGRKLERTKGGTPLIFILNSRYRSLRRWQQSGFPCLGGNVVMGFLTVPCIFVLPLSLSVNIVLIRSVETLLELCIKCFVSSTARMLVCRGTTLV